MTNNNGVCFSCKDQVDVTDKSRECGWSGDVARTWICKDCESESNREYEQSSIDVDNRESELAESESI